MSDSSKRSKRIARNTFFLYVRMLFLMFISFYTSRVILQNLGVEDFGISNVVGGLSSMFVFFRSSLANVTQRYLNIEQGKQNIEGANNVFCLHQTIYIYISIIIVVIAEVFGLWLLYNKLVIPEERMNAAFWVFQFTVVSLVITILSVVYNSAIIAHEDMKVYSYIGIFEGIAKLLIAYLISVSLFDKLILYQFLLLLLALGIRIYYSSYCKKNYAECRYKYRWNKEEVKEASSMVGWNTVGTLVWSLNEQGINVLLNMFFGPAVNAARGITYQISHAITHFGTNFYTSVRPQLVKSYAAKDFDYLYKLFFASSKYSVYLLWFFCLPVMLSIDNILSLWLHQVPEYTNIFTIWVLAYSLVNMLNNPIWSLSLAVGRLRNYILIGSGVFFLAFPLAYVFLKLGYSPVSVFIVMFLVRIVYIVVVLVIIRNYIYISLTRYLMQVLLPTVCVIASSGGIAWLVYQHLPHDFMGTVIITIVSTALIFFSIITIGLSKSEKAMAKSILMKKIRRRK